MTQINSDGFKEKLARPSGCLFGMNTVTSKMFITSDELVTSLWRAAEQYNKFMQKDWIGGIVQEIERVGSQQANSIERICEQQLAAKSG